LQELADVAGIAGQHEVGMTRHQRYMRVNYVRGARKGEQFPEPLGPIRSYAPDLRGLCF